MGTSKNFVFQVLQPLGPSRFVLQLPNCRELQNKLPEPPGCKTKKTRVFRDSLVLAAADPSLRSLRMKILFFMFISGMSGKNVHPSCHHQILTQVTRKSTSFVKFFLRKRACPPERALKPAFRRFCGTDHPKEIDCYDLSANKITFYERKLFFTGNSPLHVG